VLRLLAHLARRLQKLRAQHHTAHERPSLRIAHAADPGFSFIAIATLALGWANTASSPSSKARCWRPLPFPGAERLVRIFEALDENGARPHAQPERSHCAHFAILGAISLRILAAGHGSAAVVGLNNGSPALTVPAARVTSNFFSVLGLPRRKAQLHRRGSRDHAAAVAIISDELLAQHLNGRRDVLGSAIVIDARRERLLA